MIVIIGRIDGNEEAVDAKKNAKVTYIQGQSWIVMFLS